MTMKKFRMTRERKFFLSLVEKMDVYFDDDGLFQKERSLFAFEFLIEALAGSAPKSAYDIKLMFGAALYYCSQPKNDRIPIEECSERCRGGEAFAAALGAFRDFGAMQAVQKKAKKPGK